MAAAQTEAVHALQMPWYSAELALQQSYSNRLLNLRHIDLI
jgi:hypothetical protein